MKILIDVTRSPHTGIGHYSWGLLEYLNENDRKFEFIGLTFPELISKATIKSLKLLSIDHNPTNQKEVEELSRLVDSSCDIYIPTNFSQISNPRVPIIQVVHDLIYMLNPQWQPTAEDLKIRHGIEMMEYVYNVFLPKIENLKRVVGGKWNSIPCDSLVARLYVYAQTYSISRASSLITVSDTTKRSVDAYYVLNKPIETIYPIPLPFTDNRLGLHRKDPRNQYVFIYIANFEPRKNIDILLQALSLLPNEIRINSKLILIGRGLYNSHYTSGQRLLNEFSEKINIEWYKDVSEVEKNKLLLEADFMIYPSLDEGFGIPLLEAMIHKLPIITYLTPASQEVCGNSAIYYSDLEPESLMKIILKSIEQKNIRSKYESRLLKQAERFRPLDVVVKFDRLVDKMLN